MWPKKANKEPNIELSSEHTELKSVCLIALGTLIEGTVRVQEANKLFSWFGEKEVGLKNYC